MDLIVTMLIIVFMDDSGILSFLVLCFFFFSSTGCRTFGEGDTPEDGLPVSIFRAKKINKSCCIKKKIELKIELKCDYIWCSHAKMERVQCRN